MNEKTKENPINDIVKINKSLLLNWLYLSPKEIEIEELGKWITDKTDGKYVLLKAENS